jgi:hypothetical protein
MGCHPQIKARAGPHPPPPQRRPGHSPPARVPSRLNIIVILILTLCHLMVSPPFHPGGMPACSRWLSGATPPERNARESRTPAGVPAIPSGAAVSLARVGTISVPGSARRKPCHALDSKGPPASKKQRKPLKYHFYHFETIMNVLCVPVTAGQVRQYRPHRRKGTRL